MLSSALVISIILRSQDRLSSPYHRIMFFMCFWDIVSSACIALTILPMPSDVHEIHPSTFPGRAYGNTTTCAMQGFFIFIGQAFAGNANGVLNIFYVCTLRYGMSEKILNRRVLPISLAVFGLLSLPAGLVPLSLGLINPRPRDLMYCTIGPYPENCNRLEGIECIRGNMNPQTEDLIFFMNLSLLISGFFFIVVPLALVVVAVFKTEKMARRLQRDDEQENERQRAQDFQQEDGAFEERDQPITFSSRSKKEGFEETRTVGRIALMYIAAFFITWIWTIFAVVLNIEQMKNLQEEVWDFLLIARHLFQPLQGFFNSLIFVYNKVHNLRKSSPEDVTFFKAFKIVVVSPGDTPREIIVSSIEMVKDYVDAREEMESKWNGFGSKNTSSVNLAEALSATGMRKADFAKIEDYRDGPPQRKYYASSPGIPALFTRNANTRASPTNSSGSPPNRRSSGSTPPSSGLQPSINSSDLVSNGTSGDGLSFMGHSLLSGCSSAFSSTKDKTNSSGQEEEGNSRSSENMADA